MSDQDLAKICVKSTIIMNDIIDVVCGDEYETKDAAYDAILNILKNNNVVKEN